MLVNLFNFINLIRSVFIDQVRKGGEDGGVFSLPSWFGRSFVTSGRREPEALTYASVSDTCINKRQSAATD